MNACISAQRVHAWTALTSTVSAKSHPSAIERSLMHLSVRYSRTTCTKCKLFQLFTNKLGRFILVHSVTHGLVSPFLLLSFPTPATATAVAVPERNELSSLSSYTSCRRCHGRWSFSASLPLSLSLPLLVGHVCFGRMPSDSLPISLSLSLSRSLLFRSLPLRGPSINDVYTGRGSGEWGAQKQAVIP